MKRYKEEWKEQNPEDPTWRRQYNRTYLYGLSPEEQERLPVACMICGREDNLHIDHSHKTGLVRGVLCRDHNIGLGYFSDNPDLLVQAAIYLLENDRVGEGV